MKERIGVFETNSSSSHVVVIPPRKKERKRDQNFKNEDNIVVIKPREYGWDFDVFYSPEEKLSYILTDVINSKEVCVEGLLEKILKIVSKYSGKKVIFEKDHNNFFYPYGYVDHQSSLKEGNTHNGIFVKKDGKYDIDKELLLDFVFSSSCKFHTGNDNTI